MKMNMRAATFFALVSLCMVSAVPAAETLKWYPSRSSLVYEGAQAVGGTLDVRDANDVTVFYGTLDSGREIVRIAPSTGRLPNGVYRAIVMPASGTTPVMTKDFVNTNYPWFNTDVGTADVLLPAFTAIETASKSVSVVGRRYVFGDEGLPREIWTCGRQILARPVTLAGVAVSTGSFAWTNTSATCASFRAGHCSGRVEQDGLIVLYFDIPAGSERVYLDIPVRAEYAPFFHACGDAIRCNPAGSVPDGTGRVFASRSVSGNGMTLDNFLPYCWVGTDDRGICYAADTDRGWIHGGSHDAVELHREADGTVVMRLNLIAQAGAHTARTIELALQASPVKPMPEGWCGWVDCYDVAGTRNMQSLPSSPVWGCYINGMARYPTFEDWTFVQKMAESARTGTYDATYLEDWVQRCLAARRNTPALVPWLAAKTDDAAAEQDLRNHAGAALKRPRVLAGKSDPVLYHYTCDADPCETLYEMPVMADEWGTRTAVFGSHADYAVYYLKKMCENGMSGVYNDNAFLKANRDWVAGGAWFDESGALHPSYGLWALRAFAKRQILAMREAGVRNPWLTIHHTNANILPILSFATNTMGMEDKYGSSGNQADWQDRWVRDYIRVVNQGLQAGCFPTSIEGPFYDKTDRTRLTRTMLATLLPHGIQPTLSQACDTSLMTMVLGIRQSFGVGAADCVYRAYYDAENPVIQADPDVMVSAYVRGKRLLLAIGSYRTDAVTVPLALKRGKVVSAENAETGASLAVIDGTTSVALDAHGFALVGLVADTEKLFSDSPSTTIVSVAHARSIEKRGAPW